MFGWGRKKKAGDPAVQEPADIHPKSKQLPTNKKKETPQAKPKQRQDASGLSEEDIIKIRTAEFKLIDIPFSEVADAEHKKIFEQKISPEVIVRKTEAANTKLKEMGFMFRIDEHEYFICSIEYAKHLKEILEERKKQNFIIQRQLIDIILFRRAEKVTLNKMGLKDKPIIGQVAEIFIKEANRIYEGYCEGAKQFDLRQLAIRLIQREKGVRSEELPDEADIRIMIEKIQKERTAAKQRQTYRS